VKIINLASEGAADLVELETRLLGGRANGRNVSGVLGKEQASSRSGRQRRAWREEIEIDGIRETFYRVSFASHFRDQAGTARFVHRTEPPNAWQPKGPIEPVN